MDYSDINKSDFINNLWYYLAFDAELLEVTWREVKEVMTKQSHLHKFCCMVSRLLKFLRKYYFHRNSFFSFF